MRAIEAIRPMPRAAPVSGWRRMLGACSQTGGQVETTGMTVGPSECSDPVIATSTPAKAGPAERPRLKLTLPNPTARDN